VLIAGPTASGKSALALELALSTGGVVINADSMQVYRDLRIITARPTRAEEALVPHHLYGHVDAAVNFSAGAWVNDAAKALEAAQAEGRLPIFIGGTGLYFKALTAGLSVVPPIPAEVRDDVRARLDRNGVEALHAELAARDPRAAERLNLRDRTRIARALEVIEATGRSLLEWQREGQPPLLPRARRTLCPHRCPLRRHARYGGAERSRAPCGPPARFAPAGHEGPWRSGPDPASAWGAQPAGRCHDRTGRHPPLCKAAVHLVPPPIAAIRMGKAGGGEGVARGGRERVPGSRLTRF
jgi:hypothetical protein